MQVFILGKVMAHQVQVLEKTKCEKSMVEKTNRRHEGDSVAHECLKEGARSPMGMRRRKAWTSQSRQCWDVQYVGVITLAHA